MGARSYSESSVRTTLLLIGYGVAYDDGIEVYVHPSAPSTVIQFDFRNGRISEEDLRASFDSEDIDSNTFFDYLKSESLLDTIDDE